MKNIKEYINNLKGYQGYIQYLSKEISKDDVFLDSDIKVKDEYIYEAHFANETKSITIKLINGDYLISEYDISNADIECFDTDIKDFKYKIKMAQIWQEIEDKFCAGLKTSKLKAVVFAGFKEIK